MGRRRIDLARDPWAARQRGPVITFFEKSAGCLGFDQGIAALISGLDVFPRGVTCCHYTRWVFKGFDLLVYVIDFIVLRVAIGMLSGGDRATQGRCLFPGSFLI